MIKYFIMGSGAGILLIAFIKYLVWTISSIKYRFFTRYTDGNDRDWCYAQFDNWCFLHKVALLAISILIVFIAFFLFMETLGIITIK